MKRFCLTVLVLFSALFFMNAQNRPVVQDIQASVLGGTRINVSWTLPNEVEPAITKLYLYRAAKPISRASDLVSAQLLAELPPETSGYTDSVQDYSDYYYAVIAYTNKLWDTIFVSMNSTVNGVHLVAPKQKDVQQKPKDEEKLYSSGTMRETPLPYLNYVKTGNEEVLISDEIAGFASALSSANAAKSGNYITPYFFEEDLISPDGGDDFLLFEVLKNTFVQEKYEEAIVLFNKLNGTNINESVRNRVYFYMAEAYFFTGDFEEAVKTFVKVAQVYPLQSKIWINYTLDKLTLPQ